MQAAMWLASAKNWLELAYCQILSGKFFLFLKRRLNLKNSIAIKLNRCLQRHKGVKLVTFPLINVYWRNFHDVVPPVYKPVELTIVNERWRIRKAAKEVVVAWLTVYPRARIGKTTTCENSSTSTDSNLQWESFGNPQGAKSSAAAITTLKI